VFRFADAANVMNLASKNTEVTDDEIGRKGIKGNDSKYSESHAACCDEFRVLVRAFGNNLKSRRQH